MALVIGRWGSISFTSSIRRFLKLLYYWYLTTNGVNTHSLFIRVMVSTNFIESIEMSLKTKRMRIAMYIFCFWIFIPIIHDLYFYPPPLSHTKTHKLKNAIILYRTHTHTHTNLSTLIHNLGENQSISNACINNLTNI